MGSQDGRCLASYSTSYTALSSCNARSRTWLATGSSPPASAYPTQNALAFLRTQSRATSLSAACPGAR